MELKRPGRFLTNREMFNSAREPIVAKSQKLHGAIARNYIAVEFTKQLQESEADQCQDSCGKFLLQIDEYANTDSIGNQFGNADFYYNAKLNLAYLPRTPGSKGKGSARDEKGEGRKGTEEVRI